MSLSRSIASKRHLAYWLFCILAFPQCATMPRSHENDNDEVAQQIVRELLGEAQRTVSLEMAIARSSEAIRADPYCALCYQVRGLAWAKLGQREEALRDLLQAWRLDGTLALSEAFRVESLVVEQQRTYQSAEVFLDARDYRDNSGEQLALSSHARQWRQPPTTGLNASGGMNFDVLGNANPASDGASDSGAGSMKSSSADQTGNSINQSALAAVGALAHVRTTSGGRRAAGGGSDISSNEKASGHNAREKTQRNYQRQKPETRLRAVHGSQSHHERATRAGHPAPNENVSRGSEQSRVSDEPKSLKVSEAHDSLALCEAMLKNDPSNPDAHLCTGLHYYHQHKFKKAIKAFTRAVSLDKNFLDAYLARAKAYGAMGRYRKALRNIKRAIAIEPRRAEPYVVQAWVYHCRGNAQEEEKSLRTAIMLGYANAERLKARLKMIEEE